jgi:hypothetical protein
VEPTVINQKNHDPKGVVPESSSASCRLAKLNVLCHGNHMTETLSIRLPKALARDFHTMTHAAGTNPTAVLRRAAMAYVNAHKPASREAMQKHIRTHAGTWDGNISGKELLAKTRS